MENKTYHKLDCQRVFKRYDVTCPRCQELAQGQPARKGWGPTQDQQAAASVHAHFSGERHLSGGCGIVCTYGEW